MTTTDDRNEEAHLTREGGATHLHWRPSARGERAIEAYRARLRNYPVSDETQEGSGEQQRGRDE